jgi:zinc transport system substrate-binding protein
LRLRIILICFAFVAGPASAAVGLTVAGVGSAHAGSTVVASFYPLAFAARSVAPGARVENLTPPGAEPHDLEVSPRDVARIRDARLVLVLGHGFQPQLERAAGGGDRVLRLLDTRGLERLSNGDPHVWLDPLRYALIVERLAGALGVPAERLVLRLHGLDRAFRRGLRSCLRRELVTSHEAFAYLAGRYGLRQVAITGLSPEVEPTPRTLERIVDVVRRTGATTVFFETLVSPRLADTVARATGARTDVLDPIEGVTHGDYFSVMRANLAALRRALGCR